LKLLIQELQIMNIQMRIITDENVDQMLSLSYSNNINELLQNTYSSDSNRLSQQDETWNDFYFKRSIMQIRNNIKDTLTRVRETKPPVNFGQMENIIDDGHSNSEETDSDLSNLPNIPIDIKPSEEGQSDSTIPYAPGSPAYQSSDIQTNQSNTSSPFVPDMETQLANTPLLIKKPTQNMPMTPSISPPSPEPEEKKTILEVEEDKKDTEEKGTNEGNEGSQTSNSNETKKIVMTSDNEGDNNTNSNDTKKINL
jgi:hypothetical protein